ncbi:MAG: 30S ribosomal protein S4 [Candidatus Vogelbacteria bacterium RIFOXYD1_FULL_44_32]|uniref:Small ribosomal subunit protein uS4 n=1 Tax=Candidatus Vogelbacteria bacterium RIFOXYD1_FULL_44_32 TaxID=1802438 RepID=A0A1G2QDG5_9BACT|nr:MAG: 30S ribosomal protein S4 [Candidatus Vogelbacteria bacterium RIFOXYD1_FULL_44_32]
MGLRIGPKYKIARRLEEKIFSKTQTTKFAISGSEKSGKQGGRKKTVSEYGRQLLEKQKAKYTYGVNERQFSNYVKEVRGLKNINTSSEMFRLLESRLDNIVFRLGLANSRLLSRQMVSHGHILVNGRRVTVPSARVRIGDKISVRVQSQQKGMFASLAERLKTYTTPNWLIFDDKSMAGEVKGSPEYGGNESNLNFASILEFYSRV